MDSPTDNSESSNGDQQPHKRRRRKSLVWEHFTTEEIDNGRTRANCNHCKKSFAYITGTKQAGTSHLKRHIVLGICPVSRCRNNLEENLITPCTTPLKTVRARTACTTNPRRKLYRHTPRSAYPPFDQDCRSHDLAKMIILHEYPLNIVEDPGFINFVQSLLPQFNMLNIDTIQDECINVYMKEKQGMLDLLGGSLGRVNLSLDLWTSDRGLGYVILTGYFTDSDWKLRRRILSVVMLLSPDSEFALNYAVVNCLSDWSLEDKLFTLTLDQSFANEDARRNLRGLLPIQNPLILNGQLLLGNCYARVLGCLAKDLLGSMVKIIKKVRDSVKYVKLQLHEEKFIELKQQLQNRSTKSLIVDDQTKWNTTYEMLVAASELKEVFSCLEYKETPTMEEWRQVETLCKCLKLLFDAANILVAPTYPTTDLFFHEVWKIQLDLTNLAMSKDAFTSELTKPLKERFNEYWKDCILVFAIAVVMDPRFKMKLVEFCFNKIYGEDAQTWIKVVDEGIHELYLEYIVLSLPPPTFVVEDYGDVTIDISQEEVKMDDLLSAGDDLSDFDVYMSEIMSSQHMKSELDQYLEESLLPRVQDFDVLGWWKLNMEKYPTLSRMASDILCIPVSTVGSESVFDTVSKKMDGYRSSLRPMTVEALICAKDWLKYGSSEYSSE